jgi:serine/threonine protein kinase
MSASEGNLTPTQSAARRDPYRLTGETFDRRYRLESFAGAGSFGAVYHALDLKLNRTIAVKILKPDIKEDSAATARELFQREALTAGRLTHPNIVAVTDTGEEQGFAYLVMEWLEGRTLEDELRARAPLSPSETAQLLAPIADAIHTAHEAGVIHRDIKPSNIHLGRTGHTHVKVLDFGIAKVISSASAASDASRIAGTLAYMSPEQISGGRIDRRTDIYSLGVLLHQMIGGRLPFHGETQGQLIHQHIVEPPPPLHSLRSDISPALSAVVQRALAKEPEARQQTAHDLYTEFIRALEYPNADDSSSVSSQIQLDSVSPAISGTGKAVNSAAGQPSFYPAPPVNYEPTMVAAQSGAISAKVASPLPVASTGGQTVMPADVTQRASDKTGTTIGFAIGFAILLFILSLIAGFVPRWAGWDPGSSDYDSFVLSLLPVAARDAVFGAMLGASLSELWGRPAPRWSVTNARWTRALITHGALGAMILMLPFVLLRTSTLFYPLVLAFAGFLLGMIVCGARFAVHKIAVIQRGHNRQT